ncbi:MAG: TetR family transcriptional regulator, partial [Rhizobium sp.]|nr:TetR family transcriptional regulator [Rhizobium sp.]
MNKNLALAESLDSIAPRGHQAKRASIIGAAADVFCREGFGGACIDEIAIEAGVSRQTVYNHYREKESLFMAVVEDVLARANAAVFALLSTFPENAGNLEADLA